MILGKRLLSRLGALSLFLLILLVGQYLYRVSSITTYSALSFIERASVTRFFLFRALAPESLSDTDHIVAIATKLHLANPYAYRLYVFALMARSDLDRLGQLRTSDDIICVDNLVTSKLFSKLSLAVDTTCETVTMKMVASKIVTYAQTFPTPNTPNAVLAVRPTGPAYWSGKDPLYPEVALWTMMVPKIAPIELPLPLEINSAQEQKEIDELVRYQKTITAVQKQSALYWADPRGALVRWFSVIDDTLVGIPARKLLTYKTVAAIAAYNATIEAWYLKYYYWTPRPFMCTELINSYIPAPNFPGYPSGHSTIAGAVSAALTSCGVDRGAAETLAARAKESGDSRIWAGIHFQTDNVGGQVIGIRIGGEVAQKFCK